MQVSRWCLKRDLWVWHTALTFDIFRSHKSSFIHLFICLIWGSGSLAVLHTYLEAFAVILNWSCVGVWRETYEFNTMSKFDVFLSQKHQEKYKKIWVFLKLALHLIHSNTFSHHKVYVFANLTVQHWYNKNW